MDTRNFLTEISLFNDSSFIVFFCTLFPLWMLDGVCNVHGEEYNSDMIIFLILK